MTETPPSAAHQEAKDLASQAKDFMEIGKWNEAAGLLERAVTLEPTQQQFLSLLVVCFRNNQDTQKLDQLYRTLQTNPPQFDFNRYVTNGLPFLGKPVENPHQDFVFISGAPRSGTTSFGRILNLHNEIAIFTERFTPYFGYHPDMFLKENIYSPGHKTHRHIKPMERLHKKIRTCAWIGDKRPNFSYSAPITMSQFKDKKLRVFHIYRSIEDVCWSYEHKKKRSMDEWSYKHACFDLNTNNRAICEAMNAADGQDVKFYITDYTKLHSDADYALGMFEKLDLSCDDALREKVQNYIADSMKILDKERVLSDEAQRYIEKEIDWDADNEIRKHMTG
ncbi:sulfotransferase domain-containing protein [Marinicaulis aureus]|uniref:Sulfotransferase domain-containing protein n=1 Tax=Hyphococcus aureus TaxID=2666033 RepID=A0ABW1KZ04_9PROT